MPPIYAPVSEGEYMHFSELDHNIYYLRDYKNQPLLALTGVDGIETVVYADESSRTPSWSTYQSGNYGTDRHSIAQKDPLFVAPWDRYYGDYHLTENSPAIAAGGPCRFVTHDIEGKLRKKYQPDIGAYEFTESNEIDEEDTGVQKLVIFPNPNREQMFVRLDDSYINILREMIVFNSLGQVVLNIDIQSRNNIHTLSTLGFEAGIYFLQLKNKYGGSIETCRFIIE